MERSAAVNFCPPDADPLEQLATRILTEQRERLPDLSRVIVLLPEPEAAPRLRHQLLESAAAEGFTALLGPRILTPGAWLAEQPLPAGITVIDDRQRELLLMAALEHHRNLFGDANLWALAESLLALFDELTLNQSELPEDPEHFLQQLAGAYGAREHPPEALALEARLVHTLWYAWHQQLHAEKQVDRHTAHLLRLAACSPPQGPPLYLAGFDRLTSAEAAWLRGLLKQDHLRLLLHSASGPEAPPLRPLLEQLGLPIPPAPERSPYGRFLQQSWYGEAPLTERAHLFAAEYPESPARGRLSFFTADGAEAEARAVELQIRCWLAEGGGHIGIVCESRRLARRVRALLERAGVPLDDASGWALATTSAAAALERWLECIEESFPHEALLDLLKSPFVFARHPRDAHLSDVYRLEQDVILHGGIGRGLDRYRQEVAYRRARLPTDLQPAAERVTALLERLEGAAAPLQPLLCGSRHPPAAFIAAIEESLAALEMAESLTADAAGARLLEELRLLGRAGEGGAYHLDWASFRAWFGRTLERFNFRPATTGTPVRLLSLEQSRLARFDALVLAGAEREHLPGSGGTSPFFNEAVRSALGLPGSEQRLALRRDHFFRLLEAAPQVLVTYRRQQDGETVAASPWVESLRAFHQLAWGDEAEAEALAGMLRHPKSEVVRGAPPLPPTARPAPTVPPERLPRTLSATAHQQLIDCPYRFFAAQCLGLTPPEALREALEKSDYGERVHRCLEAFHGSVPGLPGPFGKRLTQETREEARALLEEISIRVFARDLEDNFLHRGWLHRWQARIPDYLEWQMKRERQWHPEAVELRVERQEWRPGLNLKGRLDRLDRSPAGIGVVDYKTGRSAAQGDVEAGEAVQLPFYALLAEEYCEAPVAEVAYLALDGERVRSPATLAGPQLAELSSEIGQRLAQLFTEMEAGKPLPAWGEAQVCRYCELEGICRRQSWI